MRPLKLTVSAFGPYGSTQVVDFRELGDRNFFLIHGRTGGGKTSLLDAICYALYGDTSGAERDGRDMRSHHADAALPTAVTFDFSIGQEQYRVTRSPQQERPRKKGAGTTTEPAQATLWRRTGVPDDSSEGTVLANQPARVTAEIERLLGFQSSQFRQVVILPQGKFRQLLMAESAERERILEALFKTEVYRSIEVALKEAAKSIKVRWQEAKTRADALLQHAGVATLEELVEKKQLCEIALEEARRQADAARERQEKAQQKVNEALQTTEKLKELDDAKNELSKLESLKAGFQLERERLERAREAARLEPSEKLLREREDELARASAKLKSAYDAVSEALNRKDKSRSLLEEQEKLAAAREELGGEVRKLEQLGTKVNELAEAKDNLSLSEKNVERLNEKRATLAGALADRELFLEERQQRLREEEKVSSALEANRQVAKNAEQALQSRRTLEDACSKLTQAIEGEEKARLSWERCEADVKKARSELAALEKDWFAGQAAYLARQLAAGVACPVCGSKEHPAPAAGQQSLPGEGQLESCRSRIQQLEEKRDEEQKKYAEQQRTVTGLNVQVQTLMGALGEAALDDLSVFQQNLKNARAALQTAESATARLTTLKNEIETLANQQTEARQNLLQCEKALAEENEIKLRLSGVVAEKENLLPQELRDSSVLARTLANVSARLKKMEQDLSEAQRNFTDAEKILAMAEKDLLNAQELKSACQVKLESARKEFSQQLQGAQFGDEEAFRSACLPPKAVRELEQRIAEFDRALSGAVDRWGRAQQASAGLVAPDMEKLTAELTEARELSLALLEQKTELSVRLDQIIESTRALRKAYEEKEQLDKQFETVGKISDVAGGENSKKLTFQRFVLSALLDDVLCAASERLHIMSQGRYRLQRLSGVADLRKAGGLELEVFDSYTGTTRAVATLSGGESFLASLSLALGLADVVQSYAGGIHLDTMFVDEGFGSLDPESLDFAIRALRDLQKSGRLVGIISHVPELRERIDARLEVVQARHGSLARFSVG